MLWLLLLHGLSPRGEADYRMNGMDWKGTDTTLSHAVGMWWNCTLIIALDAQQQIHVWTQRPKYIQTLTYWVRNIWVFFLLQKVKMKLLTTAFRAYFRKGYNLRSHLLVKYKRLAYMLTTGTDTCSCMYMYRPDGNRWRDEDHNTCIRSRLIYHRHSWDIRTFHVGPPYWDIRKIHTHTLKYISNVCLNSGVKDMQENKKYIIVLSG